MIDSLVGEIKKIFIDIYYISVSSREGEPFVLVGYP